MNSTLKDALQAISERKTFHIPEEFHEELRKLCEGDRNLRSLIIVASRMASEAHDRLWDRLNEIWPKAKDLECTFNVDDMEIEAKGRPKGDPLLDGINLADIFSGVIMEDAPKDD